MITEKIEALAQLLGVDAADIQNVPHDWLTFVHGNATYLVLTEWEAFTLAHDRASAEGADAAGDWGKWLAGHDLKERRAGSFYVYREA